MSSSLCLSPRLRTAVLVSLSCLALACGSEGTALDDGGALGESSDAIINGTPDTTHQAVVALVSNNGACTGTIIKVDAQSGMGYALTAAHCGNLNYVLQGNNYNNNPITYPIVERQTHPSYNPNNSTYDFMMVRFSGASANTPVIPALTPAEDNLSSGTGVLHVGYGLAGPAPGSPNSIRRSIQGNLSSVSQIEIQYNQPSGGPCSGDSGGPQLTLGTERVAGVISHGDQNCNSFGVSGRVSAVYNSFIAPFMNGTPGMQTCQECTDAVTVGQGPCKGTVDACIAHGDCNALLGCFQNCNTNACYQTCINSHMSGYTEYLKIFDCVCDVGCVQECQDEPICDNGGSTSSSTSTSSSGSGGGAGTTVGNGSGGSMSSGVGGAGNDDGWNAGDLDDESYDGELLVTTCTAGTLGTRSNGFLAHGLLLLAAALGLAGRRRSGRS